MWSLLLCAYGRPRKRAEVANRGRNAGGRLVLQERRAGQSAKVAERDSLRHREMPLRNQELLERLHVGSGRAERKVAGKGGGGACFLNGNFCLKRNHLREKRLDLRRDACRSGGGGRCCGRCGSYGRGGRRCGRRGSCRHGRVDSASAAASAASHILIGVLGRGRVVVAPLVNRLRNSNIHRYRHCPGGMHAKGVDGRAYCRELIRSCVRNGYVADHKASYRLAEGCRHRDRGERRGGGRCARGERYGRSDRVYGEEIGAGS